MLQKKIFRVHREYDHKLLCEEHTYFPVLRPETQDENSLIHIAALSECFWHPGYVLRSKEKTACISLSLVCSGSCAVHEEYTSHILKPGDLAVYKRRNFEDIRTHGNDLFRKKVIVFNCTPFLSGLIDLLFLQDITFVHFDDPTGVEDLFDRILSIFRDGVNDVELNMAVFHLLYRIQKQSVKKQYSPQLQHAVELIHASAGMRISREKLAEECNMSISSLNRMFSRELQCSPGQYVLKKRFEAAKRYLIASRLPIKQIALECGFVNAKHFSAEFHRYYGISPREFRSGILPEKETPFS